MMMAKSWQWDVKRSDEAIRKILKNPEEASFLHYATLLLARTNDPKEVFGEYLSKKDFCVHWHHIKRRMRKDKWNQGRIHFWEEIYRHLRDDFKAKGTKFRKPALPPAKVNSLRVRIGKKIREIRRAKKMTQDEVARGAALSQQFLSRIEKGQENVSLDTLERLQKFFGKDVW